MSDQLSAPFVERPRNGRERRVSVRYPINPETECCTIVPEYGGCPAWVRDLSAGGVCLVVEQLFATGTWLTVELENAEKSLVRRLRARVIHSAEIPFDRWLHGCQFERELTAEELQAFTNPVTEAD
jgi:PilZ domain